MTDDTDNLRLLALAATSRPMVAPGVSYAEGAALLRLLDRVEASEAERDAARAECDAALDGMRLESAEAARLLLERDMARAECDVLRALLAEAMPELLGELWQESRICSVCFGYNRHSDVCLVARIDDALRSDR